MNPHSIIKYINDTEYIFLNEGIKDGEFITSVNDSLMEEKIKSYFNNLIEGRLNNVNPIFTETITPMKGMEVIYADDGLIYRINFPEGLENSSSTNSITLQSETLPSGITFIARWGASNNELFVDHNENIIFGSGRATTYGRLSKDEPIGTNNNLLKVGDVATKGKYDDCRHYSVVSVNAKLKDTNQFKRVEMRKADIGGMPDAVLDIFEKGCENWQYEYKEYTSIPHLFIENENRNRTNSGRLY